MKSIHTLAICSVLLMLVLGCGGADHDNDKQSGVTGNTKAAKKGDSAVIYIRLADEQLKSLITGCKKYHYNTGRHVSKLADFKSAPNGMSQKEWKGPYLGKINSDPWGNDLVVESSEEKVVVRSCGPNGVKGDSDDVTMEWSSSSKKQ